MVSPTTTFTFPTAVLFGPGTLADLPSRLRQMGVKRPLVVTDPGVLKTGSFQQLRDILDGHQLGESWDLFHGVHSNPSESDVQAAARSFVESRCDAVIAFGGGSALDVGKVMRMLVKYPKLDLAEFERVTDWTGLPRCICVPTTAGTGTEVGRSAAITLEQTKTRATLFLPRLLPKLVILDPTLTVELPGALTAATGVDALTHCIEALTSTTYQPFCDGIALEGIHLIRKHLPKVVADGANLESRGHMLVAAAMGGVACQKGLGTVHSLAHPLSALCGLHHGLANALCLTHVMRWNAQRRPGLYRRIGLACGLDLLKVPNERADEQTIQFLSNFLAQIGLGGSLSRHGVKDGHIDMLSSQAWADPNHLTNPVPVSREALKELYLSAL